MAVTYPIGGSASTAVASEDLTIEIDSSVLEGDFIYAIVCGIVNGSITDPAAQGWDNLLGGTTMLIPGDSSICMTMLRHEVTAGEEAASTTQWIVTGFWTVARVSEVQAAVARGVDPTRTAVVVTTVTNASNSTIHVLPGVVAGSVPDTGDSVLSGVMADDLSTYTTPATHTMIATSNVTAGSWIGHRNTDTTAGVAVDATNITASISGESAGITVIVGATSGGTGFVETPDDSVGITDATTTQVDRVNEHVDDVGLSDTVTLQSDRISELDDNVGVTDAAIVHVDRTRDADDNVGITDAAVVQTSRAAAFADEVGITDDALVLLDAIIDISADAVSITDDVLVAISGGQIPLDFVDDVGILDVVAVDLARVIELDVADVIGITDTVVATTADMVNSQDNIGITDSLTLARSIVLILVDTIGVTDSVGIALAGVDSLTVTDPVGIIDAVTLTVSRIIIVTDLIGITDSLAEALFDDAIRTNHRYVRAIRINGRNVTDVRINRRDVAI